MVVVTGSTVVVVVAGSAVVVGINGLGSVGLGFAFDFTVGIGVALGVNVVAADISVATSVDGIDNIIISVVDPLDFVVGIDVVLFAVLGFLADELVVVADVAGIVVGSLDRQKTK